VNIASFFTSRFRGGAGRSEVAFGLFAFGVGNAFFGAPGGVGNFALGAPAFGVGNFAFGATAFRVGNFVFGPALFGVGKARPEGFFECRRPPTFLGSDFILFPDLVKVAFRFERSVGPQTRRFGRGP